MTTQEIAPWFDIWKATFLELNGYQSFEMIQQPFGYIYMITSKEANVNTLKTLYLCFRI